MDVFLHIPVLSPREPRFERSEARPSSSRFLLRRVDRFLHEVCYPVKLFLKTGDKVGRAVLKKDDEAECEKHKEQEPEKTPDETHGRRLAYRFVSVNDWSAAVSAAGMRASCLRRYA